MKKKFALIGLGFIAPRHIKAIQNLGGEIVCACDPDMNTWYKIKGITSYAEPHYEDLMNKKYFKKVDYVSILTPNYLHHTQIIEARKRGKKVICEKPLVLSLDSLHLLAEDKEIFVTLQLRYAFNILRNYVLKDRRNDVRMNIEVHRGDWYYDSWKVKMDESGGLLFNIGIHYFDLLVSEFGQLYHREISPYNDRCMEGIIENERAFIRWKLRIDAPEDKQRREIIINGRTIELTNYSYGSAGRFVNFAGFHNKVYEDIVINNNGVRPNDLFKVTKLLLNLTEISESQRKIKLGEIK